MFFAYSIFLHISQQNIVNIWLYSQPSIQWKTNVRLSGVISHISSILVVQYKPNCEDFESFVNYITTIIFNKSFN